MKEKDIPSRAGALQKGDLSTALEMTEGGNKIIPAGGGDLCLTEAL